MKWTDGFVELLRDLARAHPQVGMRAKVVTGKRVGTLGRITWHGRDRFDCSNRYADEAMRHFRDCRGLRGFRVRLEPDGGGEQFFLPAERLVYCIDQVSA